MKTLQLDSDQERREGEKKEGGNEAGRREGGRVIHSKGAEGERVYNEKERVAMLPDDHISC